MDIEQFYAQDETRRRSAEIELGTDWTDASGARYELSWVSDTGELYTMREPSVPLAVDPFGDVYAGRKLPTDALAVGVVGWIADRDRMEEVLAGWEDEVSKPGSITWLADRLSVAGVPRSRPSNEPGRN